MPVKSHGLSGHPLYKIHESIKCRGLLCSKWLLVKNFYSDLISSYKPSHSLCRIDYSKFYEPDNVYWKPRFKAVKRNILSEQDVLLITNTVDVISSLHNNNMLDDSNKEVINCLLDEIIIKLKGG